MPLYQKWEQRGACGSHLPLSGCLKQNETEATQSPGSLPRAKKLQWVLPRMQPHLGAPPGVKVPSSRQVEGHTALGQAGLPRSCGQLLGFAVCSCKVHCNLLPWSLLHAVKGKGIHPRGCRLWMRNIKWQHQECCSCLWLSPCLSGTT